MDDLMNLAQNLQDQQTTPRPAQLEHPLAAPTFNGQRSRINIQDLLQAIEGLGRAQEANSQLLEGVIRHSANTTQQQPSQPSGAIRFHEPRKFNGKATEVVPFLREISTAIELQHRALTTDRLKVLYLSSFLGDGAPSYWYNSLQMREPTLLHDYTKFVAAFKKRFEDPDLVSAAMRRIVKLEQKGTVADFAARFHDQLVYLTVTDQTSIRWFQAGLKQEVRRAISHPGVKKPDTLEELIALATDADNRLRELELDERDRDSKHAKPSSSSSRRDTHPRGTMSASPTTTTVVPAVPSPTVPSNDDVVPMEVDAIGRKHITSEERKRRASLGLCFYCGKGKHTAAQCPNKDDAAKKASKGKGKEKADPATAGKA